MGHGAPPDAHGRHPLGRVGQLGTWGRGILQNDSAQDNLCETARELEAVIESFADDAAESTWRVLNAAIGTLAQYSPYALDPKNAFSEVVARAIERHRAVMSDVTEELAGMLDAIVAQRQPEYVMLTFAPELETALHGPEASTVLMQKTWARAPAGCFASPEAHAFLQEFADRRVANVDAQFEDEEALEDLCREGFAMGEFALLLILEPIHVDPQQFERWRSTWYAGRREPDSSEADFFHDYDACVDRAFDFGIARFSAPTS